ncbi:MAG: PEGA domain-containing protein [Candidatus Zixiibacteriota bacterium]|nr:MAG: PEGA domain-containing protein [candidate division Zixibacteria bacterium]
MKNMYLRSSEWILLPLAVILLLTMSATARSQTSPVVSITSKPSGATVILSGDYTVAGITPTSFSQNLLGLYRITAHHEGYETYHSTVMLSGREAVALDIKMVAKTRVRAAMRSLVFPGWGQHYVGSKTKGSLLTIGTLAAVATTGILQLRYDSRRQDYDDYNVIYNQTRSVEEREKMLAKHYALQKDAYDAEHGRNVALGVLAGIWAYNLLDAILFFPDYGLSVSGTNLGLYPDPNLKGIRVVGTVKF